MFFHSISTFFLGALLSYLVGGYVAHYAPFNILWLEFTSLKASTLINNYKSKKMHFYEWESSPYFKGRSSFSADSRLMLVHKSLPEAAVVNFGDVIISEIMADPTPSKELPEVDYLELYNRTDAAISLEGWRIYTNGREWRLTRGVIEPLGYLIITSSSGVALLSHLGNAVSAVGFNGLPNTGADIVLVDARGKVIASSFYKDSYWRDDGIDGGVALERVDVNSLSEKKEAWVLSKHRSGGTPGAANSYATIAYEESSSLVSVEIGGTNFTTLEFDEPIYINQSLSALLDGSLKNATYRYNPYSPRLLTLVFKDDFEVNKLMLMTLNGVVNGLGLPYSDPVKLAYTYPPARGDLVINEVLFNPEPLTSDYVEVVNISDRPIDLSQVALARRDQQGRVSNSIALSSSFHPLLPGEYVVACTESEALAVRYHVANPAVFLRLRSLPSYPSGSGNVLLINALGGIVDEFSYSESMHFRHLPTRQGVSLERVSFTQNRWASASKHVGYGTPGLPNSQAIEEDGSPTQVYLKSDIISPDNDGVEDMLIIGYNLELEGAMADVEIFTASGYPIARIARNELLGASGFLSWDGVRDDGTRVPRGIYVALIWITYPNSNATLFKKVFSVVYR